MVRIILFLLKCVLGLLAAVGFMVAAGVVAGVLLLQRFDGLQPPTAEVADDTLLVLDLADGLTDERPGHPFLRASLGSPLILREVVEGLHAAAGDARVKGLLIRAGWGRQGLAEIQELRDAIIEFRAQGKPVTAFAETFGEAGNGTLHYYLASAAGKIWMQPSGDVGMTGFSVQKPFLRQLLADFGVRTQIGQREEYKGAMAIFTESRLPEAQRRNLQGYMDSILGQIVIAVAQARNLDAQTVRTLIDEAPHRAAEAQRLGLVDALGYWDQAVAAVESAAGPDAEFLALQDYVRSTTSELEDGPIIALVHGIGPIVLDDDDGRPDFSEAAIGSIEVAEALAEAIDDEDVAAILFRVDSPGGSYVASDAIWREVQRARDLGKPVVVSMGNVAGSGGYFIAAAAHSIVAQPGTLTGSIGVLSGKFDLEELWQDLGVTWDGVRAGRRADLWSPNAPFSREEWEWLQAALDATYADFTDKVAKGRALTQDEVLAAAGGRIWSGEDAVALGLVDTLGGYRKAIEVARDAAGIPAAAEVRLRSYPERRGLLSALLDDSTGRRINDPAVFSTLRNLARLADALAPLIEMLESLTGQAPDRTLSTGPLPTAVRP